VHTFAEFNRVKTCRYGQMVFNANEFYIGRSLDLYGEFSEGEVELFRQVLQAGDVVIDVGANGGAHTLFFARHVGLRGGVLAFEPQRLPFQTLCANMALNHVTNVWCFPPAVGAAHGAIAAPALDPLARNNFGGLGLAGHAAGERVTPLFNPGNCAGNPVNVFGNIVSRNMLCVHRDTPARIAGVRAVEVPRAEEARR
jgi:hypothetical protein